MLIPSLLPILLCLQTVGAIPFVTNNLTGVSYQGTSANGVEQFQNIFYAEDTSGANRFAPPVPYIPTRSSIIQATASGAACPQPPFPSQLYPFEMTVSDTSEDCLNLRIARPANFSLARPLPVMVWIYGGGFTYGEAYDRVYNPVGLVQESIASGHPVIYVSANYRLGIFGFAASEALYDAKSENVGLRDQRLALKWVKDNIAAFGGNPDNITVFGQSAGSISVFLQIVAFGGQEGAVFRRAILESGALYTDNYSPTFAFGNTASVIQALNCSGNGSDTNASVACLRTVPLEALLKVSVAQANLVAPPYGIGVFQPVIDGDFIPDQPSRLIPEGAFVKSISVIVSWVEDDGSEFLPTSVNSETAVVAFYSRFFNNATLDQLLSLYPVEDFEAQVATNVNLTAQWYRASRILRDYAEVCTAINFTSEISKQTTNPTYLFTLNSTRLQPVWDSTNHSYFRIGHTSDIPYVFNEAIPGADNSKAALQFSAEVSRSFSAFATSGDPSTPEFDWPVAWKAQGGGNPTIFVIGGPYGSGPVTLGPSHDVAARRELPVYGRSVKRAANSTLAEQRSKALGQEKLVERCAFFNSLLS